MKRLLVPIATLTIALSSGCSFRMGDLTAASSKSVPLNATPVRSAVEGKDCSRSVLGIPISSLLPNFEEAADRALATAPGANALIDVAIYSEPLFLVVYNQTCIRVRGDAVKIER